MSRDMTWRYHANKAPKMVPMDDHEKLKQMEAEGWADTPAAFHDADAPEGDNSPGQDDVDVYLQRFKEDPEELTKPELMALANYLELEVTNRTTKPKLVEMIADDLQE